MKKRELNLGEQLISAFIDDIKSGKFNNCIREYLVDTNGHILIYKYIFYEDEHILNRLISTREHYFEGSYYSVEHPILADYDIRYDISKELFYAMADVAQNNNKKIILDYLNSRKNN